MSKTEDNVKEFITIAMDKIEGTVKDIIDDPDKYVDKGVKLVNDVVDEVIEEVNPEKLKEKGEEIKKRIKL